MIQTPFPLDINRTEITKLAKWHNPSLKTCITVNGFNFNIIRHALSPDILFNTKQIQCCTFEQLPNNPFKFVARQAFEIEPADHRSRFVQPRTDSLANRSVSYSNNNKCSNPASPSLSFVCWKNFPSGARTGCLSCRIKQSRWKLIFILVLSQIHLHI